jgi:colicin import membrane protein
MPGFFREHLRPLAGSAGLHLVLVVLLAGAALRWTSSQPPVGMAIEGYVADAPVPVKPTSPPRSAPAPEPPAPKQEDRAAMERQQREAEANAAREREAVQERERVAAERRAAEESERKAAADAAAKRKAAADAELKRKAAEETERKRVAEAEAQRRAEEQAKAEREARQRAEREADLQRRLAAEEEEAAFARSGVMDEYRAMLVQTIERNWIRPPSARAGLKCTLDVTQAPGGTVIDVRLGTCNGDQAVRQSIVNAVYKSSPLPAPGDPRAFERRLEIVFQPTE